MDINELETKLNDIDRLDENLLSTVDIGDINDSGDVAVNIKTYIRLARTRNVNTDKPSSEEVVELNLNNNDVPNDYIEDKIKQASEKDQTQELPPLILSQVGAGKKYRIEADYSYNTRFPDYNNNNTQFIDSPSYTLTAKKDFEYDRASIPRIFWVIIDKDSLSNIPPLFHDLLYQYAGNLPVNQMSPHRLVERKEADNLFLELMLKTGVKKWRAKLAHAAVRNFSKFAWRNKA